MVKWQKIPFKYHQSNIVYQLWNILLCSCCCFFVTPWHDKLITNQPSVDTMCVLYVYMYKNYSIFNPCMCCVRNNTLMVESEYKNIDSHRCSETLVIIDSNIYIYISAIRWYPMILGWYTLWQNDPVIYSNLSTYLPIYLSFYLSIYLSVYLST